MYKLYHILLQRKQKRSNANVPHLHEKGRETYKYNSTNQPFSQHPKKSRLQHQKGHGASIAKAGGKDHVGQRHDLLAKQSGAITKDDVEW